ncbi:hypothetical protein LEN26_000031 [Aphanomyces euteiches]|nr:hypothetical protein LEN26_000031 [Aphanomyces euteiches]
MMSRSQSKELPPRSASLPRTSSNGDMSSNAVDIDTLMLTINNAVAKIASIRESFEDGRPPRHSSTSSKGRTRKKAGSSVSATSFDDVLRFSSNSSTFQDRYSSKSEDSGKPPLAQHSSRSLSSSFNSNASSPSIAEHRKSPKPTSNFPDEDAAEDDVVGPEIVNVTRKTKLPFPYHKLQSTTSIELDENLTPFKELRLARLQDIKVQFHNGLPQEFYKAICRFLQTTLEIKRRFYKLKHLKECFLGCDTFDALIDNGFSTDENEAFLICNVLLKLEYIEDITGPATRMKNRNDGFYKFGPAVELQTGQDNQAIAGTPNQAHAAASIDVADFSEASDEMHALISEESLAILARVLRRMFEKTNKIMLYKGHEGCFLGSELVTALREMKIAQSTIDAQMVGQSLLEEQLIISIDPDTTDFQSKYTMYRLANM